jgi:hypothetical protein
MDALVYFIVVILSFYIGRCSGLNERQFKRINKIGHNPLPNYPRPQRLRGGYQPSISSAEKLKHVKPPKTGSGIK